MLRTMKTVVIACVAILAIGAADEQPAADHARALLEEVVANLPCGYKCFAGYPACPLTTDHKVGVGEAGVEAFGPDHSCMGSSDCEYHDCTPNDEDLQELVALLPKVAPTEILPMVEEGAGLMVNRERRALQLLGCEDLVVATIPFSDEQAAWFAGTR